MDWQKMRPESSWEEIFRAAEKGGGAMPGSLALAAFVAYVKAHKENSKLVKYTLSLAIATWFLALITGVLTVVTFLVGGSNPPTERLP